MAGLALYQGAACYVLLQDVPYYHQMQGIIQVKGVFLPFSFDESPTPIIAKADENAQRRAKDAIFHHKRESKKKREKRFLLKKEKHNHQPNAMPRVICIQPRCYQSDTTRGNEHNP